MFGTYALYTFLFWLIGLPIVLAIDAYIRGRYNKTIFYVGCTNDDLMASKIFWPFWFGIALLSSIGTLISLVGYVIYNFSCGILDKIEKKGKQVNDVDYQAEKHLLRKK